MVTILPKEEPWYVEPAQNLSNSLNEGYKNRHDTMALQKAVGSLGPNASPRDILNAVTGVQTYNPQAKQQFTQNYLATAEMENKFEEAKAKRKEQQDKVEREKTSGLGLIDLSPLPDEEKAQLRRKLESGELSVKGLDKHINSQVKNYEKARPYKAALDIIDSMESIIKKENLGRGSQFTRLVNDEVANDYGRYEQLGKALISFATPIVIRNKLEFETLAEKIYDPSLSNKEKEGVLESMRQIISSNLKEVSSQTQATEKKPSKPDFSAFER